MDYQASIKDIFRRYLAGTYTDKDLQAILAYFQLEEESQLLTDLILQELDREVGAVQETAAQELADSIGIRMFQKIDRPISVRPLLIFRKIAVAVLLLLLSGGIVYYYISQQKVTDTVLFSKYGEDVLPGGNRATITLDDGTNIVLSEEKNGVVISDGLAYDDGTSIEAKPTSYAILKTPNGGQYHLTLHDGTKVWLNAGSSLRYPTSFDGDTREVELTGEAYFDVEHQVDKPFVVLSEGQQVKVLGTEFAVRSYKQETVQTTLVRGRVAVDVVDEKDDIMLLPGQQLAVYERKSTVRKVNTSSYTGWKDGMFIFHDLSLTEVLSQLEKWYDIEVQNSNIPQMAIYGEIHRSTRLSEVLELLEAATGKKFEIKERRLLIKNS
ncbi:MAG TPA: FecR domain-containing protein [Sphingobacterium sp.]|nr:FecR domain-containing protein [Sphingobacterium sp.]